MIDLPHANLKEELCLICMCTREEMRWDVRYEKKKEKKI